VRHRFHFRVVLFGSGFWDHVSWVADDVEAAFVSLNGSVWMEVVVMLTALVILPVRDVSSALPMLDKLT
jgi:hypothetical protein